MLVLLILAAAPGGVNSAGRVQQQSVSQGLCACAGAAGPRRVSVFSPNRHVCTAVQLYTPVWTRGAAGRLLPDAEDCMAPCRAALRWGLCCVLVQPCAALATFCGLCTLAELCKASMASFTLLGQAFELSQAQLDRSPGSALTAKAAAATSQPVAVTCWAGATLETFEVGLPVPARPERAALSWLLTAAHTGGCGLPQAPQACAGSWLPA